jgi:hypothetical protein
MVVRFVALALAGLLFGGCSTTVTLREQLEKIPAKHLGFYRFDPTAKLSDRVSEMPAALLQLYSREEDMELRPYIPSTAELQQIDDIAAMLPEQHHEVLKHRLIGIYCVKNFAGSGMADWILGPNDEIYTVLVLHPRVFRMTASELLTLRINSAFEADDSGTELLFHLSDDISALTYIMLHESTHIVDYVERLTPYVEPAMLRLLGESPNDASFTDMAWTAYREVSPSIDFPYQKELRFYSLGGQPCLEYRDAIGALKALRGTPFASLYASVNWAEDLAEFVTFYYLSTIYKVEGHIQVYQDGQLVYDYRPMSSAIVTNRNRLLDPLLLLPVM